MAIDTVLHAAKTLGRVGESSKVKLTYPISRDQLLIMVLPRENIDPGLLDLQLGNLPMFEYCLKFFVEFNVAKQNK